MLELLRRLVRQQTVKIGGRVPNLYGAVPGESPPLAPAAIQSWLWSQLPGRGLPTIDEFYAAITTSGFDAREVVADHGTVIVSSDASTIHLVRGVVTVPSNMAVGLAILLSGTQGECLVMLDGVLQRRGADALELSIAMDKGDHLLEILAYTKTLAITLPPHIKVSASIERLEPPRWHSVEPGYLDPALGVSSVRLTWFNDLRAGGWRLARREQRLVGILAAIGELDQRGEFGVTFAGDQTSVLVRNEELCAGSATMGTVLEATYEATSDLTAVRVRLEATRSEIDADWVGRPAGIGRFADLTKVTRTGSQGTVSWQDTQVRVGNVYEYRLQAYGLLERGGVSPWSETRYVRAGDVIGPGPITFFDNYPVSSDQIRVRCRFATPDDDDYGGVRVYFREYMTTGLLASASSTSLFPTSAAWAVNVYSGAQVWVYSAVVSGQGVGFADVYEVASNDATSLVVVGEVDPIPSGGWAYSLRNERPIFTDFGKPSAEDQFSFDLITRGGQVASGEYVFKSFDFTGNESDDTAPRWVYSASRLYSTFPNPLFGPFTGEILAGDYAAQPGYAAAGFTDGMCYLPIAFNAGTKEVWVYTQQSREANVPTPDRVANRWSATITRPPGDVGKDPGFRPIHKIGTRPGWYRRILAYGVGFNGELSDPVILETQAVASAAPPPAMTALLIALRADDNGYDLEWSTPPEGATTWLSRDGLVLKEFAEGVTTFSDTGVPMNTEYKYGVQFFRDARTSDPNVFVQVGFPNGQQTLDAPTWLAGYPRTAAELAAGSQGAIELRWVDNALYTVGAYRAILRVYQSTANGSGVFVPVSNVVVLSPTTGQEHTLTLPGTPNDTRQYYVLSEEWQFDGSTAASRTSAPSPVATATFSAPTAAAPVLTVSMELNTDLYPPRFLPRLTFTNIAGAQLYEVWASYNNANYALVGSVESYAPFYDDYSAPVSGSACYYLVAQMLSGATSGPSNTDCVPLT